MTSRQRVIAALNHQQPDRCPIDLGSSAITGMNASTMYRLRKALGLEDRPIKVIEPFQMLGKVDEDLAKLVQTDVVGLWNRSNMMGFSQDSWKPFRMDDGTPTLIGSGFECDINEKGDRMVYACGDRSAKYAQCMPKGGSFFDNLDHFDEPFDFDADEEDLTPLEDFKEDFKVATDEDARHWEEESIRLFDGTNYAIFGLVGCGGLGGHIIDQLSRIGVSALRVCDGDVFEPSNLNRQLLSDVPRLGISKAKAAADHVVRVNPDVSVEAVEEFLTESNAAALLAGCDVVVDALDNIPSRRILAAACEQAKIPYVYGAIQGWIAQAGISMPEDNLIGKLFPQEVEIKDKSVLSFTPALCASMQVSLCVKLLVGRPVETGTIYYFDLLNQEFETIPMV